MKYGPFDTIVGLTLAAPLVVAAPTDPAEAPGGTTASQPVGAGALATFRAIDRNGDNRLTRDEAAGWGLMVDGWSSADRDNDGYLDENEFAAAEWDLGNEPQAERQ